MKRSTEIRRRSAFTLLEVLAAVAILGIWFSVLASVAIQGQRAEGENERRVRASLLADRVLADLELGFELGEFPQAEETQEFEENEFLVRIESLPLTSLQLSEMDPGFLELLEGDLAELAVDMRTVLIEVSWLEGNAEERVTRLAYAWDSTRLYEELGADPRFAEGDEELAPGEEGELDEDEIEGAFP